MLRGYETEAQLLKTNGYEQTTDTCNIMDVFQSIMLNEGCSVQKATYCVMILLIQEQESDQPGTLQEPLGALQGSGWGERLNKDRHEETFGGDGNILYLDFVGS